MTVRGKVAGAVRPRVPEPVWQGVVTADRAVRSATGRVAARRRAEAMDKDLCALAKHFGTDKWGTHRYAQHYQRHLEQFRDREFALLEIGVGGYSRAGVGGASLRAWERFFPRARIIGLDIADKSFVDGGRIRTFQGSQDDPDLLDRMNREVGPFLVIVDDGSHQPRHVRATFSILFPLLLDGGVYAIEDTQTSYWPEWGGSEDRQDGQTSMALVKDLLDGLNYEEFVDEDYEPTYSDLHVVALHAFHNLVLLEKGTNREGTRRRKLLKARYPEG